MKDRIKTTPDLILKAIIDRLRDKVAAGQTATVYASTVSTELPPNPGEIMYEVSLAHNFAAWDPEFTGAGNEGLHTNMTLMVTISTTVQLDEVGHDTVYLTDETRGVLGRMTAVLAALSLYDPVNDNGDYLLCEPLRLTQGQIPPKDDRRRGFVTLLLDCQFDWDLGEDAEE